MQSLKSQPAHHQQFATPHAQIDERRRARVMHDHRHIELAGELLCSGEMVRMGMGIDEIPEAQTILCRKRGVAVDLAELRVDQCRSTGLLAADEIGPAPAGRYCFIVMRSPLISPPTPRCDGKCPVNHATPGS